MRNNAVWIGVIFLTGAAFGATAAGCAAQRARADAAHTDAAHAVDAGHGDDGARTTGIGGIFFKAKDPKKLKGWYVEHLGFPAPTFGVVFDWRDKSSPDKPGSTTWAPFKEDTTYFDPTASRFMINYRVEHLDALLAHLRAAGVKVDDKVESEANGRFAWATDPEGNRFELWEPKPGF